MDGAEHVFYAKFNKIETLDCVVLCLNKTLAIGCGGFKYFDSKTVEIKRMFVHVDFRNKGVASMVLIALETWAKQLGYDKKYWKRAQECTTLLRFIKKTDMK